MRAAEPFSPGSSGRGGPSGLVPLSTLAAGDACAVVRCARDVRAQLAQRHRYAHTLRVTRLAGRLAKRHGESVGKAQLAGLLHDIARLYDGERLLRECARRGIVVSDFERRHPVVLHATLGAEIARERYGVEDPAVLSAIRKHTLGAREMSRLDMILYLADGLEPGRTFEDRGALEALAFEDLDRAMGATLRASLAYLRNRNLEAAPATLAALETFERLERRPPSV